MGSTRLTTQPTAGVLKRLLADSERTKRSLPRIRDERSVAAVAPQSREYWAKFADVHLAVSPETGHLLYLLARSSQARTIVEFGTSFGVSTICLAAAVADNGGGLVIGTELEPTKADATRKVLAEAGLDEVIDIRDGDARETLRGLVATPVDFVFLDGAKDLYLDVLNLLEANLRQGAVIVADNASRNQRYLNHVRGGGGYFSIAGPGDDVEISLRLA